MGKAFPACFQEDRWEGVSGFIARFVSREEKIACKEGMNTNETPFCFSLRDMWRFVMVDIGMDGRFFTGDGPDADRKPRFIPGR